MAIKFLINNQPIVAPGAYFGNMSPYSPEAMHILNLMVFLLKLKGIRSIPTDTGFERHAQRYHTGSGLQKILKEVANNFIGLKDTPETRQQLQYALNNAEATWRLRNE